VLGTAEEDARIAGFDGYLRKPIRRADLLRLMAPFLGARARIVKKEEVAKEAPEGTFSMPTVIDPALVGILRDEIIPVAEHLKSHLVIGSVRGFADRVAQLAAEYADPALVAWVADLRYQLEIYSIDGIALSLGALCTMLPVE